MKCSLSKMPNNYFMNKMMTFNMWKQMIKLSAALKWVALIGVFVFAGGDLALAKIPDNQAAILEIRGNGVTPSAPVSLIVGNKQSLTAKADRQGNFMFSKLQYYSYADLDFHLIFPNIETSDFKVQKTIIDLKYDPTAATIKITGKITPGGNVSFDVNGENRAFQMAGPQGDVFVFSSLQKNIAGGNSRINAQIVNVAQACCPAIMVPATPINFTIASMGIPSHSPAPNAPLSPSKKNQAPSPYKQPPAKIPGGVGTPNPNGAKPSDSPGQQPKKSPAPYMILGGGEWDGRHIELPLLRLAVDISNDDGSSSKYSTGGTASQSLSPSNQSGGGLDLAPSGSASFGNNGGGSGLGNLNNNSSGGGLSDPTGADGSGGLTPSDMSFKGSGSTAPGGAAGGTAPGGGAGGAPSAATSSSGDFERTYVGGVKSTADKARDVFETRIMMLGAFIDGRVMNNTLADLQALNARTMNDYYPSEALCRFGTLPRSLAASEARIPMNRQAISQMILANNLQSKGTIFEDPERTPIRFKDNAMNNHCKPTDQNGGLKDFCKATNVDLQEADMDYTNVLDRPLTLNVDFSNSTDTSGEKRLAALIKNLTYYNPIPQQNKTDSTLTSDDKKNYYQKNGVNMTDTRHIAAARQLSADSLGTIAALKAEGTTGSADYMKAVLLKLGLNAADAKKLIGDKPSYSAQMDILTKKIYQDPTFFANLYESPVNVDRQRVAMLAISLMQERDLLEALKRKELLLSGYLTMKLDSEQRKIKDRIVTK